MAATAPPPAKLVIKPPPIPPNQTLYVTNLPSAKMNKVDLKTALYLIFSTYGPVLDIVAMKTQKMRGQAHIVFRDTQAATQAMRSLDGFQFLGKDMKISYAKTKSDTVAKLDGTYKLPVPAGAASNVELTETQQSIFNAPAPASSAAATHGLPARPPQTRNVPAANAPSPDTRGQKRPRDEEDEPAEEEESDEDVAMEEDSDDE
ncbi:hypothetical protein F5Y16DRAFT_193720 [Xylariaceae sp. FL0255]|nr:hypothetical protein F5Y16DRAFT_193720 [Xylariaceae sp. FL0255]